MCPCVYVPAQGVKPPVTVEIAKTVPAGAAKAHALHHDALGTVELRVGIEPTHQQQCDGNTAHVPPAEKRQRGWISVNRTWATFQQFSSLAADRRRSRARRMAWRRMWPGYRDPLSEVYSATCVDCGDDDDAGSIRECQDELCKRCMRKRLAWERDNGLIRKSEYRNLVRELSAQFI
jgi:hypothetical protein